MGEEEPSRDRARRKRRTQEQGSRQGGWGLGIGTALLVLGCGGRLLDAPEDSVVTCESDSECADGKHCEAVGTTTRSVSTFWPGCPPGNGQWCATNLDCGPGGICGPPPAGPNCARICAISCAAPDANPCGEGTACRGAACELLRCDDPDYTGCPTGMTCAVDHVPDPALPEPPGAYSLFGTDQYPSSAVGDQGPQLTDRQLAAAGAGCVFLRCDESGSFDCANGFRCDTARAEPTSSGCVPIACQELGRCSSDALICEPTSKQPRRALSDLHGCVAKNCEEGLACPMFSVCNFETPGDGNGCGYLRCDEPGGGCIDSKCDPEPKPLPSGVTPVPNGLGCIPRHCALDGVACPAGYTCAPEDPQSGSNGCVWVATGSAGTGASAGAGGTSGSGGAGGLGQSGGPDAVTTGSGGVAGTPGAAGAPFRGMCR